MDGLKETEDVMKFVDVLLEAALEAMEDGRVDFKDLRLAPPVISAANEALKGSDQIKVELKDLSKEKLEELALLGVGAGYKLMELYHKVVK